MQISKIGIDYNEIAWLWYLRPKKNRRETEIDALKKLLSLNL